MGVVIMPTREDLKYFQKMPLNIKVAMTRQRIREWVNYYGRDGVYISFSGGKDSTVLLHIVRNDYPDIEVVFVDTGLEYPEIKQFVKTFDNVTILRPEMTFRQVIEKYGYPIISKEVSECVEGAKKYLMEILKDQNISFAPYQFDKLLGIGEYKRGLNKKRLAEFLNKKMINKEGGSNLRLAIMLGMLTNDKKQPIQANPTEKNRSMFSQEKYKDLLFSSFKISNKCCNVMKKNPIKQYAKKTQKVPITAQMACESRLRTQKWIQNGCNAFDSKRPISNPMSFWTEQDVLQYIKENDIKIASVYGDIVPVDSQLCFDDKDCKLCTTGCKRTGCVFCGFGAHLEKGEGRFQRLKRTHPKLYDYCINGGEYNDEGLWVPNNQGLGMKHVFDTLNNLYGSDFLPYD